MIVIETLNHCTNKTYHLLNVVMITNLSWKKSGPKLVDRWIKEHSSYRFYCQFYTYNFIIILWQDALLEAEKSNTKIKPVNIFKADSSLCLRKPSLYPSSKDDDTTWDTASHSTSFFCINDLPGFGSNKELESIRRDSLTTDDPKSFKRKSKRKQLFKVNSVDDAIFK